MSHDDKTNDKEDGSRQLSRRTLLRVATTGALAVGASAAGISLIDRDARAGAAGLPQVRDHRVSRRAGAVQMAIARGNDPALNARRAVETMGGMGAFVRKGETVLIKPNVGWNRLPEQAANTEPAVVAELVRLALAAGASRVWVTDVPVNTAEQTFARSGIKAAAEKAGATVVLPTADDYTEVAVGGRALRSAEILKLVLQADRIINVPIVKHHGLTLATMAMKNWFGVVGGRRNKLHQNANVAIADLAAMVKPTLTVMDATRILMANGPTGGNLADVKKMNTVAAGIDEVALDAFGATLLGHQPGDIGTVVEGAKVRLGRSDWKSLNVVELGG